MKGTIIGAAVAAAFGVTSLSAHAGCVDPRAATQHGTVHSMPSLLMQNIGAGRGSDNADAADNIVGTWHVTYTTEGAPGGEAFIQWHGDRTEWENVNFPILNGNICEGSWKPIDRTHVFRSHVGWLYTNGILTGYFTETETDEVAHHGNAYSGLNDTKIYDLDGNLQIELLGTASATRIPP
jgi:hypothetical protein